MAFLGVTEWVLIVGTCQIVQGYYFDLVYLFLELGTGNFQGLQVFLNGFQDLQAFIGMVIVYEGEGLFGFGVESTYLFH